jgi:hypothetical protein
MRQIQIPDVKNPFAAIRETVNFRSEKREENGIWAVARMEGTD